MAMELMCLKRAQVWKQQKTFVVWTPNLERSSTYSELISNEVTKITCTHPLIPAITISEEWFRCKGFFFLQRFIILWQIHSTKLMTFNNKTLYPCNSSQIRNNKATKAWKKSMYVYFTTSEMSVNLIFLPNCYHTYA